jgi:hypothetical protein
MLVNELFEVVGLFKIRLPVLGHEFRFYFLIRRNASARMQ